MPAINQGQTFMNGVMGGANFVSTMNERRRSSDRRDEAIAMRKEENAENKARNSRLEARQAIVDERAKKQFEHEQKVYAENADMRRKQSDAVLASTELALTQKEQLLRTQRRQEVAERGLNYSYLITNGQEVDNAALDSSWAEAQELGVESSHPYAWTSERIGKINTVAPVLDSLLEGDSSKVDAPETLEALNYLWSSDIRQGVGEKSADGRIITDKSLARLERVGEDINGDGKITEDEYRVVPTLNITYDDGTTAEAPLTVARSSNPNDPVKTVDVGDMIENLYAQKDMSVALGQKDVQARITSYINKDKSKDYKDLPASAKLFEYLTKVKGYSKEKAEQFAFQSKGKSIEEMATTLAKAEYDGQPQYGPKRKSLREFRTQWIKDLGGNVGTAGGGGGALTPEDVMPLLGDPKAKAGKTVRDESTGFKFKSDGSTWTLVK